MKFNFFNLTIFWKRRRISPKKGYAAMKFQYSRKQYYSSCCPQIFSLPSSIIYYITKNPSNPKIYQKLIKTCKYFFVENNLIIVDNLISIGKRLIKYAETFFETKSMPDIDKLKCKIWITETFKVCPSPFQESLSLELMPKIFQCDATTLNIREQTVSFNDFLLISKRVEYCFLNGTVIISSSNKVQISFNTIVANLPCILHIWFKSPLNIVNVSVKGLLEIPHFQNLKYFALDGNCVTESFEIKSFFDYLKQKQDIRVQLSYHEKLPGFYKDMLHSICNEVIKTAPRHYTAPYIAYPGQSENERSALLEL